MFSNLRAILSKAKDLAVVSLLWTPPVFGQVEPIKTPEAMFLQLDRAGFGELSQVIFQQALKDIVNAPLPTYTDRVQGVDVTVSKATYSVDFDNLELLPRNGSLFARVEMKLAKVYADTIRLQKNVLGVPVSSTCRYTEITVSGDENLTLTTEFTMAVNNQTITVSPRNTIFKIRSDDYEVRGPQRCSGEIGIGSLIKYIVRTALEEARANIEKQVHAQVKKAAASIAQQLNEATHLDFTYVVEGMPPLPDLGIELSTAPASVALTDAAARFVFAVNGTVEPAEILKIKRRALEKAKSETPSIAIATLSEVQPGPLKTRMGKIGINPELFNEIFAQLTDALPERVELDPRDVSGLDKILNTQSLSSVWPDLLQIEPDEDLLKIFLGLSSSPRIELGGEDKLQLKIRLPGLDMAYQYSINRTWHDYFDLALGLDNHIDMAVVDGQLNLSYRHGSIASLGGDWAPSYQPTTDIVEWDVFETLLLTIFDYLYAQGPLMSFALPSLHIAGHDLHIDNAHIDSGKFIAFDMGY